MSAPLLAFVANDNVIELTGLKGADGSFITAATVRCTEVKPVGGAALSGTFPITMGYVSGSDATYRGTLENTLPLVDGTSYEATVTVAGSGIPDGLFTIPFRAITRKTQ